jgi:hypothetical protein
MMKTATFKLRLTEREKEAFRDAAELSGIPVAAWMRERLRRAARIELEDAGKQVPFVKSRQDDL